MKVNKQTANIIWEAYFGTALTAVDAFGFTINKNDHGNTDSSYGWDVDHIWPLNPGDDNANPGSNSYDNVQPLLIANNLEKGNSLQGFVFDDDGETKIPFTISKVVKNNGKVVGRMKVYLDGEWGWAYEEPEY